MGLITNFYVLSTKGKQEDASGNPISGDARYTTTLNSQDLGDLVQATYLALPGQTSPVQDPNNGVYIPTSLTDPTLTEPRLTHNVRNRGSSHWRCYLFEQLVRDLRNIFCSTFRNLSLP